jgi:hypothetical protein
MDIQTTEMLNARKIIQQLRDIASNRVVDLFNDHNDISESIPSLCSDINFVLKALIEQPETFDIGEDAHLQFLTKTLPVLAEAFLRRQTNG